MLILAGMVSMVFPAIWMICSSFKTLSEITAVPLRLLPQRLEWGNYLHALETTMGPRAFVNSIIVTGIVTGSSVATSLWGGFTFAKLRWRGRDKMFLVVLATLMVPGFLMIIPRYVIVSKLDLINTYGGVVLPYLITVFGVFMAKQFMLSIPDELMDAATVDGCSTWCSFWRIIVPLCKPIASVLAILTFNSFWDELLWGVMVLTTREMATVPVAIAYLKSQDYSFPEVQMAAGTLSILPVLIFFVVFQRYIIQGISLSGIKG